MHPAMPFITEALWCNLTGEESLVIASWPTPLPEHNSDAAKKNIAAIQEIITEIRRFRNDQGINGSAKILASFSNLGTLADQEAAIRHIVRCDSGGGNFTTKIEIGSVTVEFDLSGAIDVKAERAGLTKDLAQAEKDRATAKVKLDNDGFMAKAPLDVVTEIRERLAATTADIERMTAALAALPVES
jgi:valyl-tRNA synthetase